jgi:D-amino-acid dehydrogenase
MRVAVVGAGITGLLTAYYFAKNGHDVNVLDAERHAAMRTSYANGGQISVSNSEVWTTWANVRKGIKWMLKKDAPLLIRPGLELDKALWLAKFLYHTANNDYSRNTVKTIQLGLEARKLYQEIRETERINYDYSECGILHIYKEEKYFQAAKDVQSLYEDAGCDWKILNTNQTYSIDPAISHTPGIIGGAWTPQDSVGDIHKFCTQLADILEKKYGVWMQYNFEANTLQEIENFDVFNKIVVCNGVGARKLSKSLGDNVPIYPVKGYSITVDLDKESQRHVPKVSLLDDQAKIVTSTLGNRLRVAGTAEFAGENYDIRKDRIDPLLAWTNKNFPRINTHSYSSWACLRPMTPNMMPIVKQSSARRHVYYNTGHGHLGWTLAPTTGKQVYEMMTAK